MGGHNPSIRPLLSVTTCSVLLHLYGRDDDSCACSRHAVQFHSANSSVSTFHGSLEQQQGGRPSIARVAVCIFAMIAVSKNPPVSCIYRPKRMLTCCRECEVSTPSVSHPQLAPKIRKKTLVAGIIEPPSEKRALPTSGQETYGPQM